jgi:hypothetical protein
VAWKCWDWVLNLALSKWDFLHVFQHKFSQNWDSCVQYHEKWCLHWFLTDVSPHPTQKCLEVDPISGFKYSHLNILGPMHYRKIVSEKLLFVLLCSRQKPGGGATSHAKRAGRRLDPKFDDYTQNSSDLQSKFKNQPQNNIRA